MRPPQQQHSGNIGRLIRTLDLTPHPREGGYYRETTRSLETVMTAAGERSLSTSIYFLVLEGRPTELHRLPGPELFHYYMGDPLELFLFQEEEPVQLLRLGPPSDAGARPQILVPGGVWQAARVVAGGSYSLVGTTMSPGFDFADYNGLDPEAWSRLHPHGEMAMRQFYGLESTDR